MSNIIKYREWGQGYHKAEVIDVIEPCPESVFPHYIAIRLSDARLIVVHFDYEQRHWEECKYNDKKVIKTK